MTPQGRFGPRLYGTPGRVGTGCAFSIEHAPERLLNGIPFNHSVRLAGMMRPRIVRHGGNEILEISSFDFDGSPPDIRHRMLREKQPEFGWVAVPARPQGIEVFYWRHYGPRAFDLRVRCGFCRISESSRLYCADAELLRLLPVVRTALASTVTSPIHHTAVWLDPVTTHVFRLDAHRESLQLLFHMAVSNLELEQQRAEPRNAADDRVAADS